MASIVLGKVGGVLGGALGSGLGSSLGGILGNFAGQSLDRKLFGTAHQTTEGRRLDNLTIQTSGYGDLIPIIYGTTRLAGNIIWSSKVQESVHSQTEDRAAVSHTHRSYSYSVSVAIALCEGLIVGIDRIWANDVLLNTHAYNMRIYNGSEDQLPDPVIESIHGIGKTPAYRGIAYVVFEDFPLAAFNNHLPHFSFEVRKHTPPHHIERLEDLIQGVVMIPGSGEFVYDTIVQSKITGDAVGSQWVQRGQSQYINQHNTARLPNSIVSLNHLQSTLPNVKWIAPVACWFATDRDIGACRVMPGVEFKDGGTTSPDEWRVAQYTRSTAHTISAIDGRVQYGGSINDKSMVRYLSELRKRGIKTMFYPMFLLDIQGKPWRGRLTGTAEQVAHFFNNEFGYNQFILHYAGLVKGHVDAFIIGSELVGLTKIQGANNTFPVVDELVSLAAQVKAIMGSETKIIYAADWSEYHHTDGGWYHMDPLWSSPNIDVIGIDAYFPLTDTTKQSNLEQIVRGWDSGEGYDFYYEDAERTTKRQLDPKYAWKNIEWWWNNEHYNPDSLKTAWQPRSKKIWFTEYGFPSVDGASNQPNVFFDASSSESRLPHHSEGNIDFIAQRLGLHATEKRWQNSEMIEQKFVWCWDARPYPLWPSLETVWSDAKNWSRGHWIQGKLSAISLPQVLADLCIKAGLQYQDFDVSAMSKSAEVEFFGFIIDGRKSIKKSLEMLQNAYFFDIVEYGGKLTFLPRQSSQPKAEIALECLIPNSHGDKIEILDIKRIQDSALPEKLSINYIDRFADYRVGTQYCTTERGGQSVNWNIPIISDKSRMQYIAKTALHNMWMERLQYSFILPMQYLYLAPADVIILHDGKKEHCLRIVNLDIGQSAHIKVSGVAENLSIYECNHIPVLLPEVQNLQEYTVQMEILDIPHIPIEQNGDMARLLVACCSNNHNWSGCMLTCADQTSRIVATAEVKTQATMGKVLEKLLPRSHHVIDRTSEIIVNLIHGELVSIKENELFSGQNLALIGNEIIQFQNAQLLQANQYRISGLLRGQHGTEHEIKNHQAGERFVLLDNNLVNITVPSAYFKQRLTWQAYTDQVLQESSAQIIEYQMQNLKPLSPVDIRVGEKDGIIITWHRRSFKYGIWRDFGDVVADHSIELYSIRIFKNKHLILEDMVSTNTYQVGQDILQSTELIHCEIYISAVADIVGKGSAAKWKSV